MKNDFLPKLWSFAGRYKYMIVLVLFLVVLFAASDNSLIRRYAQKREIRALQEQIRTITEQKDSDEALLEDLSNDSLIIDRIAREKFNMRSQDEDVFIEER